MKRASGNGAVLYCRVSTTEQAQEGVSLDAQESALRAYCSMRGLEVVGVVVDAGVSAGKELRERPGGRKVLELVRDGAGHVVAYKLDRLFRNAADALLVTEAWDSAGVALHLADLGGQSVDTSTAMGRFFITLLAGVAELERGVIRERTKAALSFKRARGERTGAVPLGYRATAGGQLEPDADEQAAVARILTLRRRGLSQRDIACRLNEEGIPARGSRWHKTTVARLLRATSEAA